MPSLAEPITFLIAFLLMMAIVSARFFLVAGLFHWLFYTGKEKKFKKIGKPADPAQFRREMINSFSGSAIFSLVICLSVLMWQRGYTAVYLEVSSFPWWWLPLSFLLALLLHEVYYYAMHRILHIPSLFRKVHRVHHHSKYPTPWTAFSFHPIESLLLALIFPVQLVLIPMHPVVILVQLVFMTVSSVINHLDMEIFPAWVRKWFIGGAHHSVHHSHVNFNYGLHFTFLDKWFGTNRE
jgi:sterol desaturase/sphingolipid hydroxylase (fatty acid hydroxylase superfamily)